MTAPLPPVVNGSVYAVPNVQISADNVLPDALVGGLPERLGGGQATSTKPRDVLGSDHRGPDDRGQDRRHPDLYGDASYVQATPGVSSEPSPLQVTVWQVTKQLPVPVFLSWGVPVQRRRLARQPHLRSY